MEAVELLLDKLREAPWNPNEMNSLMRRRLRGSIRRFGLVENLVVRRLNDGLYEVLSGNQRLRELRESRASAAPCIVVDLDDAEARLLAQALNHIRGQDDLGLRAEVLKEILASTAEDEVLALLPETKDSLQAFASLGQEDLAGHLQMWQAAQAARLKHLQVQLTGAQMEVVEEALKRVMRQAREHRSESPNVRGTAIYLMCKFYLEETQETQ